MLRTSLLFLALSTLVATGCSKKADGGGDGTAKTTEAKAKALPKLGLAIDVPAEVSVENAIMGDGHMLMGGGIGALTIELEKEPPTLETVKSDAGMYSPKNLTSETLPDGFAVTFDNTGSMGASYFVEVHRKIDGKDYKCSTTVSQPSQGKAALAACKTLKKG